MQTLYDKIEALPMRAKREVENYIDFLVRKYCNQVSHTPSFDWACALKDIDIDSVELQHQITSSRLEGMCDS